MIRRPTTSRAQKPLKNERVQKDNCSRVGFDYQVEIPSYIASVQPCSAEVLDVREIKLWSPHQQPPGECFKEYIDFANRHSYPTDMAMIFLHWHQYNITNAMDDMSNYVPLKPNWTKSEVKRFLKCIDSKPRKHFVEVKKGVPGRPMGDICQLYYSIAAPFKASTRTKRHGALINQCFGRAVRNNLIVNRWTNPTLAQLANNNNRSRRLGENEDTLESQVELHLLSLHGMTKTRHLLGRRMLSVPYPVLPTAKCNTTEIGDNRQTAAASQSSAIVQNGINGVAPSTVSITTHNAYQPSSSGASSQVDCESTYQGRSQRYSLPTGIHYDHAEFVAFCSKSEAELCEENETKLLSNGRVDFELKKLITSAEVKANTVIHNIGLLKPACGFPEVSYRWSKTELALVLHAMSVYGNDFSKIARTVGSKSESFIRDFYNQIRGQFPLDSIIRYAANVSEPVDDEVTKIEASTPTDSDVPFTHDFEQLPISAALELTNRSSTVINSTDYSLSSVNTTTTTSSPATMSVQTSPSQDSTTYSQNNFVSGSIVIQNIDDTVVKMEEISPKMASNTHRNSSKLIRQPRRGKRRNTPRTSTSIADESLESSEPSSKIIKEVVVTSRSRPTAVRRGYARSTGRRISHAPSYDGALRIHIGIVPGPTTRNRGRRRMT